MKYLGYFYKLGVTAFRWRLSFSDSKTYPMKRYPSSRSQYTDPASMSAVLRAKYEYRYDYENPGVAKPNYAKRGDA